MREVGFSRQIMSAKQMLPVLLPQPSSVNLRVIVKDHVAAEYISNILKRISLITAISVETPAEPVEVSRQKNEMPGESEELWPKTLDGADSRLVMAACIMETSFHDPHLSLRSVSKSVGLSTWHFSRRFNGYFRVSFRSQLRRIRLRHAMTLLESTSLSIKEIAAQIGYKHLSDLGRDFKKLHSIPPSLFRRDALHAREVPIKSA